MQLSQGHDRQSLCPKGLTRWDRLCAARVFRGDGHERGQGAVYLPVSTSFSHATEAHSGFRGIIGPLNF